MQNLCKVYINILYILNAVLVVNVQIAKIKNWTIKKFCNWHPQLSLINAIVLKLEDFILLFIIAFIVLWYKPVSCSSLYWVILFSFKISLTLIANAWFSVILILSLLFIYFLIAVYSISLIFKLIIALIFKIFSI